MSASSRSMRRRPRAGAKRSGLRETASRSRSRTCSTVAPASCCPPGVRPPGPATARSAWTRRAPLPSTPVWRRSALNETLTPLAPLADLSIAEVVARVRAGEQSALELTDAYLERIAALDEPLHVYRTVTAASG